MNVEQCCGSGTIYSGSGSDIEEVSDPDPGYFYICCMWSNAVDPELFIPDPELFIPDPELFIPGPELFIPDPELFVTDPELFIPDPVPTSKKFRYRVRVRI
jgi:hypothetical protein